MKAAVPLQAPGRAGKGTPKEFWGTHPGLSPSRQGDSGQTTLQEGAEWSGMRTMVNFPKARPVHFGPNTK